jgi:Zn-dependent protease
MSSSIDPSWAETIQHVSVQLVPFIMAVVFHEYAHGFVANRWGDSTAKDAGRLTLNPIPHMDPIGTVLFPLINMVTGIPILFGWARPVPIDPRRFRKYRAGLFWVSFAGPGMNFLLANLSALVLCAIVNWMPEDSFLYDGLTRMAGASITLNYALGIFNLIPLPPLDGSKMIQAFLSPNATRKYEALSRYSFLILMGLLFTGAFAVLSGPILYCSNLTLFLASRLFNLPV